jgi:adenylate kinase family enzyme
MDLLQKFAHRAVKQYTLNDLDSVKNREDRSNLIIHSLELKSVYEDDDEEEQRKAYEIYSNNLHTHKNIKTLILNEGNPKPYNVLDFKLEQMQLEELVLG